ncbi:MAG TPA: hypothetical protein VMM59_11740 [Thermohalobaculum sp.]|nr:hypothetical protein [Thermohalobaculum sp.]
MQLTRYAALAAAVLALAPGPAALAHETGTGTGGQGAGASGVQVGLTVRLHPDAAMPAVVQVPLGAHVHLTVIGAGAGELHLHGYDILAEGGGEAPAVIVFDAAHAGRFPLEAHVEDDLLGRRDKAVLYVEVRAP